jgi:hypothetical protein
MRFIYFNTGPKEQQMLWVENCIDCHVPMRKVFRDMDDIVMGLPETFRWRPLPRTFTEWEKNPIITGNDFWYCEECKSLWASAQGHWVKAIWNGKEITEPEIIMQPIQVDPKETVGPKPYPEATLCHECYIWREQRGDWQICPKCGTGEQVMVTRLPEYITTDLKDSI